MPLFSLSFFENLRMLSANLRANLRREDEMSDTKRLAREYVDAHNVWMATQLANVCRKSQEDQSDAEANALIASEIAFRRCIEAHKKLQSAMDADNPPPSASPAAAPDLLEALRNCPCPAGGWTGMPKGMVATVQDCVDAGVCGCDCGAAVAKATAR